MKSFKSILNRTYTLIIMSIFCVILYLNSLDIYLISNVSICLLLVWSMNTLFDLLNNDFKITKKHRKIENKYYKLRINVLNYILIGLNIALCYIYFCFFDSELFITKFIAITALVFDLGFAGYLIFLFFYNKNELSIRN